MVEEAKRDHCAWMMCIVIILLAACIGLVIYMILTNEPDIVVIERVDPEWAYYTNTTEPIPAIEEPATDETDPTDETTPE